MPEHKKRITAIGVLLVLFVLLAAAACGGSSEAESEEPAATTTESAATTAETETALPETDELVIAGYGGVTSPLLEEFYFEPFSEETGIDVQVQTVPGEQLAGIAAQNEAGRIQWDMTLSLADNDAATMLKDGYLATMPEDLQEEIGENIEGVKPYGVPSRSGAVQIACNVKLAEKCPTNAVELFDTENFPGFRTFPSFQPLVMVAFALLADGVPHAELFPESEEESLENVDRAIVRLEELRPSIRTFFSSSTEAYQLFTRGEVTIGGLWNGSASEFEPTDRAELVTTWTDAVRYSQWDVVYKGAPNEANAWRLLRWINEHPEATAKYLEGAPAGTANPQVFMLLSEKTREQLPASGAGRPPLADTDAFWYTRYPSVQQKIDDFWKDYTSG